MNIGAPPFSERGDPTLICPKDKTGGAEKGEGDPPFFGSDFLALVTYHPPCRGGVVSNKGKVVGS